MISQTWQSFLGHPVYSIHARAERLRWFSSFVMIFLFQATALQQHLIDTISFISDFLRLTCKKFLAWKKRKILLSKKARTWAWIVNLLNLRLKYSWPHKIFQSKGLRDFNVPIRKERIGLSSRVKSIFLLQGLTLGMQNSFIKSRISILFYCISIIDCIPYQTFFQ